MRWRTVGCACVLQICVAAVLTVNGRPSLSKSEIQATGKVLFRALRDSECKVKCKSGKNRPVCGTDGITYLSKCELKRAKRCEGKDVDVKKMGKCSVKDVPMTKCFQEKEEALGLSTGNPASEDVFIPECKQDGTFAEVQCHRASGYCWCVNKDGRPHPGTSTKNSRPNCKVKPRPKPTSSRNRRKKGKGSSSNGCSNIKRNEFNTNIIRVFTDEYNRSMRAQTTTPPNRLTTDSVMDTLEKQVVEWKFSQYDKDHDDSLRRKEVKTLRKLVKKYIKPRACAKQFLKYCDSNNNRLIERSEWSLCLGVDINISFRLFVLLNSDEQGTESPQEALDGSSPEDRQFFPPPSLPDSREPPTSRPPRISPPVNKPDDNPRDCLSEQSAALIQDRENPGGGIFVPNCVEGKWSRAQCHNSTGYCWCVDETNGRPIVGTSTHMVMPSCDFEAEREMKGCAYARKQSFIAGLQHKIIEDMAMHTVSNITRHGAASVPEPEKSIHETAVRWKFSLMDSNSNQILEREEYEDFKNVLRQSKGKYTRKCSRNFIRYCDENEDKKISLDEWVECMGISQSGQSNGNLPLHPKRTGKNPFDVYLKDT